MWIFSHYEFAKMFYIGLERDNNLAADFSGTNRGLKTKHLDFSTSNLHFTCHLLTDYSKALASGVQ